MADYAPPTGPPPPKVPAGWKAVWNDQYSEWFFVNIYTKRSQWDKPTEPVYSLDEQAPHGPPPTYGPPGTGPVGGHTTGASEKSNLSSNNPYATGAMGTNMSEDEKLARKLQEEEEVRAGRRSGDHRGAANDFYNQPGQSQYGGPPQQSASPYPQAQSTYQDTTTQDKGKSKGLLGKLLGKATGHSSSSAHPPVQHGYGQPGYGAAHGGYYGGGHQQQPMGYGMPGRRPGGGGMGTGGALALGAGGGLLGGALIGSALGDAGDHGNYGDGGDYGGDYGGGDYGGGDMGGGDMGGGDFGGGD